MSQSYIYNTNNISKKNNFSNSMNSKLIDTYDKSRQSSQGWCSSLSGGMNRKCKPNLRKINGIMNAI